MKYLASGDPDAIEPSLYPQPKFFPICLTAPKCSANAEVTCPCFNIV